MRRPILAAVLSAFTTFAAPPEARETLPVPAIRQDTLRGAQLEAFGRDVAMATGATQPEANGRRAVLAPFGGSKVRAFKEMDATALVVLGSDRPGSPEDVRAAFHERREDLRALLETARWSGSLTTIQVRRVELAAQILGLLHLELGVEEVEARWMLPRGAGEDRDPGVFSGPPLGEADPPILLSLRFTWRGVERHLLHVGWKITSDLKEDRHPLPLEVLRALRPGGFDAAYLSADGLVFFSAYPDNFGGKATAQLTEVLSGSGLVLLDDPQAEPYRTPFFDRESGFWMLGGRALLVPWGFELVRRFPVEQPVFGYCGMAAGDQVLLWRKPGRRPAEKEGAPVLDLSLMAQVGPTRRFRLQTQP